MTLARCMVSEGLGTAFLLAVVVGSGIMAERLAGAVSHSRCWRTPLRPVPNIGAQMGAPFVAPSDFAATQEKTLS